MDNRMKAMWLEAQASVHVQRLLSTASEQQKEALADCLASFGNIELQKLCGALEIEPVNSMEDILALTRRLEDFEFFPDVGSNRELGEYLVASGEMAFDESVRPYLDYKKIGAEYRANHSGVFTDVGYVVRLHEEPLQRQDFELRMG